MVHHANPINSNDSQDQSWPTFSTDTAMPESSNQTSGGGNNLQGVEPNHSKTEQSKPSPITIHSAMPPSSGSDTFGALSTEESTPLRRQLITSILPWALVPLGVAGLFSQTTNSQTAARQAENDLQNQALTASRVTENSVNWAKAIPGMIAPDPALIEFSKTISGQVQERGLDRTSPAQAAQELGEKPLPSNQALNDHLKQITDTGQPSELLITEQHGFQIAASKPSSDLVKQDEAWWQAVKKDGQVLDLTVDSSGTVTGVYAARSITDSNGKLLGAVRGRFPVNYFEQALNLLKGHLSGSQQMQVLALTNRGAKPIATLTADKTPKTSEVLGGDVISKKAAALVAKLKNNGKAISDKTDLPTTTVTNENGDRTLLTSFAYDGRQYTLATVPGTNWVTVASIAQSEMGVAGQNWFWIVASLILVVGGFTTAAISRSARKISTPLNDLAYALEQVSAGNMNVYARPRGTDETQKLAQTFNGLVSRLKTMLQAQGEALNQAQFYADLAHSAGVGDHQAVFDLAVQSVKRKLNVDRVVIYRFEADSSGVIVAEAVDSGWPTALRNKITDACIPQKTLEDYRKGRYVATNDVNKTDYTSAHLQLLERLDVKANLVVPIVSSNTLLGLLVAHQCSSTRTWQQSEINVLRELAAQVGLALTGVTMAAQRAIDIERAQILRDVTLRIRQSLNLETILQVSVEEVRRAIKTDRVLIYCFNPDWKSGVITAESVGSGWVRAFGQTVNDPLKEGDIDRYRSGRIWTTHDIYDSNLSPCHCAILERLQVRANIVAPIITNGKLYGLVCGHQCSGPRVWQESEIDLFAQLAVQIGFAMDQASLLKQQEDAAKRARQLNEITFHMRESLDREQIFSTIVHDTREALAADRVIVYLFDRNWRGKIVAESVGQEWTNSLNATIADPCFARTYLEKYRKGRVQALSNIYEAKLDPCYMSQLEPFEVKANVVAPILVEDELLGLLCVHQCSSPRFWQETEINFLRQVAIQLGFALDQANLLKRQEDVAKRAHQLNEITSHMRESLNPQQIFNVVSRETREAMETDRVLVYLFNENWQGTIVAESVGKGWPVALGANITDPCFAESYIEKYRRGRVHAIADIQTVNLDSCYRRQLEPFEVKANIVAPILVEEKLLGLLVAHQCSGPREWQETEINFLKQVAIQLGFALEQAHLFTQKEQVFEEQRQQKEALQHQLVELLGEVEGAARGDLTVHANVTVGEIGTVADFFNSIVESLRQIVTQVKRSTLRVSVSVEENELAIRQLADEALRQAKETTHALTSVEEMTQSIQAVADRAQQAADVSRMAASTAETGGTAMDLTVQNILSLRETIGETAKKVKRLGESSQQISKVVSLINQIALQTNLLAINAGIEAARAGEQGQGFAVVAEEVGELAARSAAATQEIEHIVETIQRETSEVVEAMELGTAQVVEGTHLVSDAKQSLGRILEVSRQIDQLVQAISDATVSQVQTARAITGLMHEVAEVSKRTSGSSLSVSNALQQTVEIARELEASVDTFKVG